MAVADSDLYNLDNGLLVIGGSFDPYAAPYNVSDIGVTGEGGASYDLTSGSKVIYTSPTEIEVQLSSVDQYKVAGLFNKDGVKAQDGTNYSLNFAQGWANGSPVETLPASVVGNYYQDVTVKSGELTVNLQFVKADNPTAEFETGIETAAGLLSAAIKDPITVNLTVGYGEITGNAINTFAAEATAVMPYLASYSTVRSLLLANAPAGDPNFSSLPAGGSIGGQTQVLVSSAQAKEFGLLNANDTAVDGNTGFSTSLSGSGLVAAGLHELSHAMGRVFTVDGGDGDIMSFYRYTAPGQRLIDGSTPAPASYFSLDGGATRLADYGEYSDASDYLNKQNLAPPPAGDPPAASDLTPDDPFNEVGDDSTYQYLSQTDLTQLDVLGLYTYDAACYCRGTQILTDRGGVAVEDLAVGDLVVTASRDKMPIRWIGHRNVDIARHPRPELARPIRIEAGALGEKLPTRDLLVSPEHALWLESSLIPARDLVNGATIRQEAWSDVEYFHVELEAHEILLAEGLPAESYLDCDNRHGFDNAGDGVVALHPDWSVRAANRPFASPALTARLRAAFAARARECGRDAEIAAFEAWQRARACVTRTNFVRNPRAEGSVRGMLGQGGRAPFHWWLDAPDGVAIEIVGGGEGRDLPFVDIRFVGRAKAPGNCCIYPEPGKNIAARPGQDWTASCHIGLAGGGLDGFDGVNLYIDEYGADGAYLTGQSYPQSLPTADDLATQRLAATRRMTRPDATATTGYVQIKLAADIPVDMTIRVAGMQIEQGDYASDLVLPPPGERRTATRHGSDAPTPTLRVA